MKFSKEARIGILVTLSLVIFFAGFSFLKGANVFSNDKTYTCFYSNIDGLQNSANVQIKGMNVGHVTSSQLSGDKGVKVVITIDGGVVIPQGTKATLAQSDLLGGKIIKLITGPGPGVIEKGGTIEGIAEGGAIDNISSELTPRLSELKVTIANLNTTLNNVNSLISGGNQQTISAAMNSIKNTADNLARFTGTLNTESGQITSIMHNANSVTANLAKSNDTIQHIISNLNNISSQIAKSPIQKTMADMQSAMAQLKTITTKINSNEGSLGLLINDKAVYNNLNSSLVSLNALMSDLKSHPSRYINLTVFGKAK